MQSHLISEFQLGQTSISIKAKLQKSVEHTSIDHTRTLITSELLTVKFYTQVGRKSYRVFHLSF